MLSSRGDPVADAEVLVGSEREWTPLRRSDGLAAWDPIGELARTDANGRFAMGGVALDAVPVNVRAAGHPVWRGELAPDAPQPLTIRLESGAVVSGLVRAADGSALAGARVRVEPALGFGSTSTTSAPDGTYRLAPLPSGEISLVAELVSSGVQFGGSQRVTTSVTLVDGAAVRWDPSMPPVCEVRGRIEAPGVDVSGWTVRGWRDATAAGETSYVEEVRTDDAGRFVLVRPPEGEVGLVLFAPGGSAFPLARLERVPTGGPDVVLRPDPALVPTCAIRGALVDSRGEPVRSADILAVHAARGTTLVHPDPTDGTFVLEPLPAGEWTLEIDPLVSGWAATRVTRVLTPDERWDAGAVRLGPGGTLVVRFAREEDAEGAIRPVTARLLDLDARPVAWLEFTDGVARSRPIAPGDYRLVLDGTAVEPAPERAVVIVVGQETTVEIELDR